jgi:ATP-dependent RNA helicase DHR2
MSAISGESLTLPTRMSKQKTYDGHTPSTTVEDVALKQGKKRKRIAPKNGEDGHFEAGTPLKEDPNHGVKVPSKKHHKRDGMRPSPTPANTNLTSEKSQNRQPGDYKHSKQINGVPPYMIKKRDALLPIRKSLPIWSQAAAIRASLKKNNVLVLTGETGSGKSTQVPQFLANEPWCKKCIAITQPRRVAAISLARRVAEEMGTFMGSQSPTAKVGYSVRFDNATGPGTKIKFLTEGMLLQEMLRDPVMSQYSAIVVDEVHERSVNVDLILGFLKNLVLEMESGTGNKRKDPLKVVIMSATADVESLVKFFEDRQAPSSPDVSTQNEQQIPTQISTCFVEGRQYPVKTIYLSEPTQDWVESALKIIFQIHYKEPLPGDILVFLTGQDTIEGLEKLVNEYAEGMDNDVPKVRSSDDAYWISSIS